MYSCSYVQIEKNTLILVEKGAWMQGDSNGGIINLRMAGLEYDVIIKCKDEMIEKRKIQIQEWYKYKQFGRR